MLDSAKVLRDSLLSDAPGINPSDLLHLSRTKLNESSSDVDAFLDYCDLRFERIPPPVC